jgi:hypothetical protein
MDLSEMGDETLGHKRWTPEEIDYLKENIGNSSISTIACNLNRTETAILLKSKRLKLGKTQSISGRVTCGEIATLLSIDRKTVVGWVNQHGLLATQKVTALKKRYTLVSPEDFWKWAFHHKEKINFRSLERNDFPPEPDWVEEERITPSFTKKNYKYWTTSEDCLLSKLINKGLSYVEIAEHINRTMFSVERRYHRIRKDDTYDPCAKKGNQNE